MNFKLNNLFVFFISFLILSCGNDDFKQQSKLGELKVLAISADKPEMNATGLLTLTPLISYIDGAGASLDYTWEACPDPGIDFGADINCNSALAALKKSGNTSFATSGLSGSFYTGNATDITFTVEPSVFTYRDSLSSTIQANGFNYLFIITYTDPANGNKITALKKILISNRTTLNTNPNFTDILFNNSTLAAYPTAEGQLLLSNPSAAETYTQLTNVGTKTFSEDMFISWYSSSGEFLFNRTDVGEENTFTPEGTSGVFVAVYRDSRGGIFSIIRTP